MDKRSAKSIKQSASATNANASSTTSGSKSLGVQKFYTKIRHKIEDNFTPKITGKLYKCNKNSMSMSALNTVESGTSTGRYKTISKATNSTNNPVAISGVPEATNKRTSSGMLKHRHILTKSHKNLTTASTTTAIASTATTNKSKINENCLNSNVAGQQTENSCNLSPFSNSTYIDSDEECHLSLNLTKLSLEDEIFEELEKVAHDESKLNAVLKNFDKILYDYQENSNSNVENQKSVLNSKCEAMAQSQTEIENKQLSITKQINEADDVNTMLEELAKPAATTNEIHNEEQPVADILAKSNTCNSIRTCAQAKQNNMNKKTNNDETLESEFATKRHKDVKVENIQQSKNQLLPKKLEKSKSSLSITKRFGYQSVDATANLGMQQRGTSVNNVRTKSMWELTQSNSASKIPILKSMPLQKRSNSFCYMSSRNVDKSLFQQSLNNNKRKSFELLNNKNRAASSLCLASKSTKSPTVTQRLIRKSPTPLTTSTPQSLNKIGMPSTQDRTHKLYNKSQSLEETKPQYSKTLADSNFATDTLKKHKGAERKTQKQRDELLDKCLEKGQQILRKVESLNTEGVRRINSTTKRNLTRTKSTKTSITKDNSTGTLKRRQMLKKLNYANEEKITQPVLESCKIIPPVLGETSDKNAELLVNVVQALIPTATNNTSTVNNKLQLPTNQNNDAYETYKSSTIETVPSHMHQLIDYVHFKKSQHNSDMDNDSDDSGHISNENDATATLLTASTVTSNGCGSSLCESDAGESDLLPAQPINTGKSKKISALLEKFEKQAQHTTLQPHLPTAVKANKKICTTVKVAELDAVQCIQTRVEIFPTYKKEVTIRLL
ncbi:uncharacterized protein LOC119679466 [Teleopsis dalmanni]|uniref:uncharacterized protein LOC119679466 n=1 Tax=Teleopsis dalmanni TaxID=139649 RepID=UPI0018CD7691|nr:uncharacterized protein LOC119679466 [Teleopsis dalmanni]